MYMIHAEVEVKKRRGRREEQRGKENKKKDEPELKLYLSLQLLEVLEEPLHSFPKYPVTLSCQIFLRTNSSISLKGQTLILSDLHSSKSSLVAVSV